MRIIYSDQICTRELTPYGLYMQLKEKQRDFFLLKESNGCKFVVSGNKILNQIGGLAKTVSTVEITPTIN